MYRTVEIKAPSELYGETDCVVFVDRYLKGERIFECGDGTDYKLKPNDEKKVERLIKKYGYDK